MSAEKFDEAAFAGAISQPNGWDEVADPVAEIRRMRGDVPETIPEMSQREVSVVQTVLSAWRKLRRAKSIVKTIDDENIPPIVIQAATDLECIAQLDGRLRRFKRSECSILHLVLKHKWFHMIWSGEKRAEYRDATPYWAVRISNWDNDGRICVVEFRLGYGHNAPRMCFLSPTYRHCAVQVRPEWGEPKGLHYTIVLGERVELED